MLTCQGSVARELRGAQFLLCQCSHSPFPTILLPAHMHLPSATNQAGAPQTSVCSLQPPCHWLQAAWAAVGIRGQLRAWSDCGRWLRGASHCTKVCRALVWLIAGSRYICALGQMVGKGPGLHCQKDWAPHSSPAILPKTHVNLLPAMSWARALANLSIAACTS